MNTNRTFLPDPLVPGPGALGAEPSLGRATRAGGLLDLGTGTFDEARRALAEHRTQDAAQLVEVSVLEAEELRDVYAAWPDSVAAWLRARGVSATAIDDERTRLREVLGQSATDTIDIRWPSYTDMAERAAAASRAGDPSATDLVEAARACWQQIHDDAVDLVSGSVDIAVRLVGESHLGNLWNHLMADWYDVHEVRYDVRNQSWTESARQLAVAIFDGFHAHLTGVDRNGEVEIIEEPDRIGFRFAPCGSGGRSLSTSITDGAPRAAAPYGFAVTTEPHDWAWNKVGICSYCVHCCQLNEVMPIDRLGYPTRVIDAPTWPTEDASPTCTWWIYRDPSLVPDAIYERVGRTPDRRPSTKGARS